MLVVTIVILLDVLKGEFFLYLLTWRGRELTMKRTDSKTVDYMAIKIFSILNNFFLSFQTGFSSTNKTSDFKKSISP